MAGEGEEGVDEEALEGRGDAETKRLIGRINQKVRRRRPPVVIVGGISDSLRALQILVFRCRSVFTVRGSRSKAMS